MIPFKNLFKLRAKKLAVKINLAYPVKWETMSFEDFREVCKILSIQGIDRERALFLCLCALAHIRPDDPNKYDPRAIKGKMPFVIDGQSYVIGAKTIAEACHDLAYIFDEIGLPPCPLKGVDETLYNVPFDVFYTADSFILRYQASPEKNNTWLKEATKALTGGRKRKLEPWERTAVVIWWNGVKQRLSGMYPYVLKGGSGVSDRTQAEILRDLLSTLNENKPQDNEKILKADTHSVLKALDNIYRNAQQRVSH